MATVKYNAKNVYMLEGFRLIPGYNEIEDALLERALIIPLFKHRVEKGIVEIEDYTETKKTKSKKTKSKTKHRAGRRNAQTLLKMMPEIYDVAALKRYIENHKNTDVVTAAKKQLSRIEAEAEKKEEDVVAV